MTEPRPVSESQDVCLLVNPGAGRGAGLRHANSMEKILARSGRQINRQVSEAPGHIGELVSEVAAGGCREILIAGGDGSLHEAVNAIIRQELDVSVGVIPVGTGNDFVKSLGTPGGWRNACEELAIGLAEHRRRRVDVGRCNDFHFVNSIGVGLDAQVTMAATRFRWLPGALAYPGALASVLYAGVGATRAHLRLDGQTIEQDASMVIACNGAWFGGLFHIAPPAVLDDGLLCVVIADPLSRRSVLRLVPKALRGTHVDAAEATFLSGRELLVQTADALPVESDGEMKETGVTRFLIRCLPGALSMII